MFTKVLILLAAAVATHATGVALVSTGVSSTTRRQDSNGNYGFSYDIRDAEGATNSRSEEGDAFGNKKGSYSLNDVDGRARRVDYIADKHGYRAVVKTNEPGTAFSAPAGTVIDSPYDPPKAPEPVAAPPAVPVVAPVAPVPVIAPAPVVAPVAPVPVVAPVAPVPVVAPAAPAPVERPPPVAHPAPVGVAPIPRPIAIAPPSDSHTSRVDIVHTVPVGVAHVAHVHPVLSPFIASPFVNQFGYGYSVVSNKYFG